MSNVCNPVSNNDFEQFFVCHWFMSFVFKVSLMIKIFLNMSESEFAELNNFQNKI